MVGHTPKLEHLLGRISVSKSEMQNQACQAE